MCDNNVVLWNLWHSELNRQGILPQNFLSFADTYLNNFAREELMNNCSIQIFSRCNTKYNRSFQFYNRSLRFYNRNLRL